ncbi:IMP-specific 5'-nucleotidase-like protein 1 [Dothidotthia symphoricarpi CBS 119687]|uniref:IMP-specific 5'-nucleotidase 1 n=1 Tax=Dothidotthia symphoricarpi CBS 119687 TaxID=1392245 RepID=A0A6A6AQN8_9PLEO|nr:IMP-specific 5'-nucleotidase-like protein 1 [Dothidotthia symphoricarpi CBS 119687]KAF2133157.1 IMP-specific 5'-nucleotidase-like protein 1 [Dothidotthia symphoricarpi CBS 119687]
MTTRYRVEYALKTHRRDQLIEWIKGLLAVPFVLHSHPTAVFEPDGESVDLQASVSQRRYAEIMRDVEEIINDHIAHQKVGKPDRSKLKLLVPTVGNFFTSLALHDAFIWQDQRRFISYRRFVPPSFNDIRLVLNTAQVMSLVRSGPLELITFDGDVTLYDDGNNLTPDNPVIAKILHLMRRGSKIGIVTAAGYTEAKRYYERLFGLLNALQTSNLPLESKQNLIIMGGESSYCFKFDGNSPDMLRLVPREDWLLKEMLLWTDSDIKELLDIAEASLKDTLRSMRMEGIIVRKERAVGIIPKEGHKFCRETLEETVLIVQKILDISEVGQRLPFCAFNGGNDVFVDIGDKSWGVLACQRIFGGIEGGKTLHVGDQFLSAGANDFKARLACTTAWIANPLETCQLLDEIAELDEMQQRKTR